MAENESDVILAASPDRKSNWVLDSGNTYHLCKGREVFSTYAAYERLVRMANNTANRVVGKGIVRFRMECPTNSLDEPKLSWFTWSVHVKVKLSSYLELLRG